MSKKRKNTAYEKKIKPNLENIKAMKGRGYNNQEIADMLKISRTTLYKYEKKEKDLRDALAGGQLEIDNLMFNAYIKKGLEGDTAILIHYAKSKLGINDKVQVDNMKLKEKEILGATENETLEIKIIEGKEKDENNN